MTSRFRLIDHTADTGLEAFGKNLPEAFANAAYGMFSIMTDLRRVRATESCEVEVRANDAEGLLFEWLNRLLYIFDVDLLLLKHFVIIEFNDTHLKAVCKGEKFDPSRHTIKIGVKSATYYLLEVNKADNRVKVIFDI